MGMLMRDRLCHQLRVLLLLLSPLVVQTAHTQACLASSGALDF